MEAAVRWSPNSTSESQTFLIADVAGNSLRYCEVTGRRGSKIEYKTLSQREKLPNFTAFDWSRTDERLVAIGSAAGEARVLRIDSSSPQPEFVYSFPSRVQRKCNSIAFSRKNLLAAGLDRARNDSSLNIYDIRDGAANTGEPYRRLSAAEVVSSTKFFNDQPDVMIAGILRQCIRLYDLRDSATTGAPYFPTRQVHFLSIDPLDDNYFASVGPTGENVVSVWDRRTFRTGSGTPSDSSQSNAVLEIKPAIELNGQTAIWSLRYSGYRRGCFSFLSSGGQVRSIEVAKYPSEPTTDDQNTASPRNTNQPLYFVKRSHDLEKPWFDGYRGHDEATRAIAFDHTNPGSMGNGDGIITIRQNRTLEITSMPSTPPICRILPTSELHAQGEFFEKHWLPSKDLPIAEELTRIQETAWKLKHGKEADKGDESNGVKELEFLAINQRSRIVGPMTKLSSRQRHQQLINLYFPSVKLPIEDTLTILDTQRRRCQEGYLFDCERNKEIVKNDAWLVELWDIIHKMENMANDDGMFHESFDLSFFGVHAIWKSTLVNAPNRILRRSSRGTDISAAVDHVLTKHRIPAFEGVQTAFPKRRQLSLDICGWKFSEKALREKCNEILDRGEYYKAIVVAVCHGFRGVAIEVLRSATKARLVDNSGLAAVIACSTVSEEQRSLCEWMTEDAEDPYLKALLAYFVTGDWNSVVEMTELPLVYRVAIALKYLDDKKLDKFIDRETADAIRHGDTEGIVLTGLAERSMDLFQAYISQTNDLQTAVLATAFTNPKYVDDERWDMWKEGYFMYMQSWRAFIPRTRFNVQHSRKAVDRTGRRLIQPPPRQVSLRCNHCQGTISHRDVAAEARPLDDGSSTVSLPATLSKAPNTAGGAACPRCGRPMPRCSICMLWLGSPDPALPGAGPPAGATEKPDPMEKMIIFCMSCTHGFHGHHAKQWFDKHNICPVPDCQCLCGLKH